MARCDCVAKPKITATHMCEVRTIKEKATRKTRRRNYAM
jgi:hypothetical protein